MDFGLILDKWEKSKSYNSQTKTSAIGNWADSNDVYDKDSVIYTRNTNAQRRRMLRNAKPDDILDIHGLSHDAAWIALENFISGAKEKNMSKLRIIHGKGNHSQDEAVLRKTVREFMEQCKFTGENGYEKPADGGNGATWVLLK
ncbi:MAG: Smr/MutS family protein [Treponema sp.]|jgi:DNA-nicking Smr family endonuclease|nr:Smr/MutS family protein [Treponema sp.]